MELKIKDFLDKNSIVIDKTAICAVSGGADSVVMITILKRLGYDVVLAHVNHHKRAQSELEEKAMQKLAGDLNVPFELLNYHYEGNDNFHNDSHNARYKFFKDMCRKYNTNIICTAHHSDDQIETILMKLMEGSNLYGYGGISICNDDGEYRIIRPLLMVSKEDIYSYANSNSLTYFEDSSNHENDFLRNRLRHFVVPLLKNECSDLNTKAMEYSIQLKEAFAYIRKQSIEYLASNNNEIRISSFKKLDIALKKDIISLMLENANIRKNNNIILQIVDLLKDDSGTKTIDLMGYKLIRAYDRCYLASNERDNSKPGTIDLTNICRYKKYKLYFSKEAPQKGVKCIKLCYNNIVLPFTVREKLDGDYIEALIGKKKLSRVFIDNKIPREERGEYPIILDNNGNILWVYDLIKSKACYEMKSTGDIYLVCEEI